MDPLPVVRTLQSMVDSNPESMKEASKADVDDLLGEMKIKLPWFKRSACPISFIQNTKFIGNVNTANISRRSQLNYFAISGKSSSSSYHTCGKASRCVSAPNRR